MEQKYVQRVCQAMQSIRRRQISVGKVIRDHRVSDLLQTKKAIESGNVKKPPVIKTMKDLDEHAYKHQGEEDTTNALTEHGLSFEKKSLLPFIQKHDMIEVDGFYDVFLKDCKDPRKAIFLGYQVESEEAILKHAGPFGVERTAQL